MFDANNIKDLLDRAPGLIDELSFKFGRDGSLTVKIVSSSGKESTQTYAKGENLPKKLGEQIMSVLFG